MPTKDDRVYLRIRGGLKEEAQAYCDKHSVSLSDLVTKFLEKVISNERKRTECPTEDS